MKQKVSTAIPVPPGSVGMSSHLSNTLQKGMYRNLGGLRCPGGSRGHLIHHGTSFGMSPVAAFDRSIEKDREIHCKFNRTTHYMCCSVKLTIDFPIFLDRSIKCPIGDLGGDMQRLPLLTPPAACVGKHNSRVLRAFFRVELMLDLCWTYVGLILEQFLTKTTKNKSNVSPISTTLSPQVRRTPLSSMLGDF